MAEIITIGEVLVEVMAKSIGQNFHETGEFIGPFPSGAPAIFIDQAAKCGSKAMIISAVGEDGFGRINIERLTKDGVDISSIKISKDRATGVAFVTYKEDGDRDFLFHIGNAACGEIDEDFLKEEDFKDCRYFHIMGSAIYNEGTSRAILKGMELALKYGAKITFDPNVRKEIIDNDEKRKLLVHILEKAHIVLAGESELFYLTEIEEEAVSAKGLLENNAEAVIVKRGSRGTTLYTPQNTVNIEAYPVEEVDPTGAGDCFAGTFVGCINQGITVEKAVKLASIAGAKAVTKKGPMEGNTDLQELSRIFEEIYQ
ncbi:sugar kinase [Natronincola ferrireducens]|uniref:Sugar or nucleoside kinase, ribokinase family n=1 Tax=Natronincola ferrireducens TaxID=393762 RepID=A0A1G8X8W7_9FIRM|nr:sugar kinase [Natronincola ferrireducens]SDJ86844.1 Sugar or nucleoside kinase, ribokinase family [Natronincola ferrireducens]